MVGSTDFTRNHPIFVIVTSSSVVGAAIAYSRATDENRERDVVLGAAIGGIGIYVFLQLIAPWMHD
jgi:hypothetical protein